MLKGAVATHPVLAVDLDGTLLRSDMLFETFWSAFSSDWRTPLRTARALGGGKAALKRVLSETSQVDIATLPYDPEVIAYIEILARAWWPNRLGHGQRWGLGRCHFRPPRDL